MANFGEYLTVQNIIATILGIVGLVWILSGLWRNYMIGRVSSWPRINARVITAGASPTSGYRGDTIVNPRNIPTINNNRKYVPQVLYSYTINGRQYQSSNFIYSGAKSFDASTTKRLMSNIIPGSNISIRYNPSNPAESYVYHGHRTWLNIWIGLLLLLIALYIGYDHNVANGKRVNPDVNSPSLTEMGNKMKGGNRRAMH